MLGTLETFIFSLVAVPQQGKARIKVSYDGDTYIIDLEAQTIDCLKKEMSRKLDLDIGQVLIKIEFDGELCILESDSMLAETIALSSSTNKLAKVFAFQKPQKTLASSPVQGGGEPKPEVSFRTTAAVISTAVLNPSTITDLFQENEFDVMLSYQWDSQAKVLLIKEALKTRYNLKVWMDIDKMRDNIFRSMAEAVDKSKVVAAFVNSKYQNSPNCLSELSYARDRKKKIAPARDFHGTEDAKGPVYIMIAGALYCNFTDKEPGTADFDSEIDNLYKNIQLYLDDMERLKKQQNEDSKQQSTAAVPKIAELEKSNLENWLKPVDFQDDVGSYANAYVKGTRLWAVEMVNEWLQNEEERVLWLNGGAGLGKSFIAWLVSQNLPATYQLGSAFYCRHNDAQKNNAESLVATLAHDLSVVLPELQAHLEIVRLADEKRVANGNVSILSNPRKAFKSLLLDGFKSIQNPPQRNILIIIDALDECGKQGDATRTALLDWITKDAAQFPAYIKLFVTARPEIDIFEALQSLKSSCLVPSDNLNQADIRTFVVDRFTCDFNPQDKQDVESVSESARKLAEKADGVFIYASLACEELKQRIFTLAEANDGQINLSVLPEFVEEYQGGIDQVYTKALVRAFEQADATSITMFQKVMGVIVAAREPLAQDTIASLLDIKTFAVGSLIMQIRPILKIDEMGLISVLHKSLTDILTSPTRCGDPRFLINLGQVHSDITVRSFDLIQELNSKTPSSSHIYGCSFWADHLSKTNQHDSRVLLTALERFVQDSIVDWVFALAVAQKLNATLSPSLESAMQFLSARFSVDGGNEVVPRLIHALMDFCAVDGLEEIVLSESWRAAVKRIHQPYAAIGEVDFEIKDEVDSSKTDEGEEDEEEALESTDESLERKRTEVLHLPAPAPSKKKRQQPVVKEDDIVQSVEEFDSNIPDESCMPLNDIESKSEEGPSGEAENEKKERIQEQVDATLQQMSLALNRQDKLETLVQQSEELSQTAQSFKKQSKKESIFSRFFGAIGGGAKPPPAPAPAPAVESSKIQPQGPLAEAAPLDVSLPSVGSAQVASSIIAGAPLRAEFDSSLPPTRLSSGPRLSPSPGTVLESLPMPASATQTLPPIGSSLPPSPAQQIPATSSYLRPQAPGSAGSYSSPAPPPPPAIIPTKPIQAPQAPATIKRHGTTKVFLSFHPESSSFVTSLSAYLVDTYGVNIQIIQGQFKEMDSCDFVIIVLSPKYETSKWHRKEAGYAVMTKKELIPILVDQEGGVVEGDEIPGLSIVGERVVDLRGSKAEDIAAEAVARIDEMSLL